MWTSEGKEYQCSGSRVYDGFTIFQVYHGLKVINIQ